MKWIKAKDTLPAFEEKLILFCREPQADDSRVIHTKITFGELIRIDTNGPVFRDNKVHYYLSNAEISGRRQITHWMPLPEPPGESE